MSSGQAWRKVHARLPEEDPAGLCGRLNESERESGCTSTAKFMQSQEVWQGWSSQSFFLSVGVEHQGSAWRWLCSGGV